MSWQPTTEKDVLSNIQQNLLIPFHTIHDECDYVISEFMLEPLINRVAKLSARKDIFDKIGTGTIDYTMDCEFDREGGTFLPKDSFDPYKTPSSEREHLAYKAMKASEVTAPKITIEADSIKDFKPFIEYDNDGLFVTVKLSDGREVESKRPISKKSIDNYLKSKS